MLTIAKESNYKQAIAKAWIGIGTIKRIQNQLDESLRNLFQSVTILAELSTQIDLAEAYFQLGLTYQAMGEHDQAEEYKSKALELFEQMEVPKQCDRVNKAFEQGAIK